MPKKLRPGSVVFSLPQGPIESVFAAGPLTQQPGTVGFRVILQKVADGFNVHKQIFPDYPDLRSAFSVEGHYFNNDELHLAVDCFARQVLRGAAAMESCYRPEPRKRIKP